MKSQSKVQFSCLAPGSFFLFDPEGDVLCRLISIIDGTAFFNMIGKNATVKSNQLIEETPFVYTVVEIPEELKEAAQQEFIDTMKKRIFVHLNMWEIGILTAIMSGKEVGYKDLQSQQIDNPGLMYEMIGVEASQILMNLKP